MDIRKLTAADAAAYRELRREMCELHPAAFNQTPDEVTAASDEKVLEWMTPSDVFPEKFMMGAFDGDRLVGAVGFGREELIKESHRSWIWGVYVRSEARGKGISKLLVKAVIDEARKMNGLEVITLVVAVTQTSARTLYTSLGFYTTGLILRGLKLPDGSYVDYEDMILWLK